MIGLDTNILLRFILRDDEGQYLRAERLLRDGISEQNAGYVNLVVLVEFLWTLRRSAKYSNERIRETLRMLLEVGTLNFERYETVVSALVISELHGVDVPDALIAAINDEDGCGVTRTFDADFCASGLAEPVA